jgi:copper(I)-binding protein
MAGDRKDVTLVSDRARPRPTRAALAVGALIGAVALAGCGAGQVTQTSDQVAAVQGANVDAGQIAVRNATIEFETPAEGAAIYPVGGNAPLTMAIVNSGAELDRLVAASSPIASSVQLSGDLRIPGGRVLTVEGAPASVTQPADAATPPAEQPGLPAQTPAAGEAPQATPEPAPESPAVQLPAEVPGVASIVLTGLHEEIQAGRSYPVVLTFERAGEVRFDVPVGFPDALREDGHA